MAKNQNAFTSSCVFAGSVGRSVAAAAFSKKDYLIDSSRFASEGNWAFCRFNSDAVPAARLGFQRGGFNGGAQDRTPSPEYLQLHLELMTDEGAVLWLPSGIYPASRVRTDPHSMDIEFTYADRKIFSFHGWPRIACHFRSVDGDAQADLQFDLKTIAVLPDCTLPHAVFGMWESMGNVAGTVRYRDRTTAVAGKVFMDHTRVIARRNQVVPRKLSIYTTLYFEDGSGLFGYHSIDMNDQPIEDYCFGVYLDPRGESRLLTDTTLTELALDADGIASAWRLIWRATDFSVAVDIMARPSRILKSWGTPEAPQERRQFSIIPLVLDASGEIANATGQSPLVGHGLAEYFNADLWPADASAATPEIDVT